VAAAPVLDALDGDARAVTGGAREGLLQGARGAVQRGAAVVVVGPADGLLVANARFRVKR
jgi:hypothetical protein